MGMIGGFGIFLLIIQLIVVTQGDISERIKNSKMKKEAIKNGKFIYSDCRGRWRLVENGHFVDIEMTDKGKCWVDHSRKPPMIVYNLSLEQAEKTYQEDRKRYFKCKNDGSSVLHTAMVYNTYDHHKSTLAKGLWFKDFETERFFVVVKYGGFWWYMDLLTQKLVRLTEKYESARKLREELIATDFIHPGNYWEDFVNEMERHNAYCSYEEENELKNKFVFNDNIEIYDSKEVHWTYPYPRECWSDYVSKGYDVYNFYKEG